MLKKIDWLQTLIDSEYTKNDVRKAFIPFEPTYDDYHEIN